jgi:hypothetical protein
VEEQVLRRLLPLLALVLQACVSAPVQEPAPAPEPVAVPVPPPPPPVAPVAKPTPPAPKPTPPKLLTSQGTVVKLARGWKIGTITLTAVDLAPIGQKDYDKNGKVGSVAEELDGLAVAGAGAVVSYYVQPSFRVSGFSVT